MRSALRIFFSSEGAKPWAVLIALTAASFFELIGFGALLPLFSMSAGQVEGQPLLGQIALSVLEPLGITLSTSHLVTLLVGAFFAKYLLTFFALTIAGFAEAEVSTRIRSKLLKLLFATQWKYLVGRKVGQLTNEVINNASRAAAAYRQSARLLTYAVQAFFYLCAAILLSLELTIVGIVVSSAFYLLFGIFVRRSRTLGEEQTKNMSTLSMLVSDTLNNIKPIRAMERQGHILETILAQSRKVRAVARRLAINENAVYTGGDAFLIAILGLGLFIATVWWQIPFSEIAVMALIAIRAIETLKQTQNVRQAVAGVESAYWSTQNQIEVLTSMQEPRTGVKTPSLTKGCRFENVAFGYDTPLIRGVSLAVPANEITVLIGPSGAGKTSIVDLLLALHKPTSGTIYIDETPLDDIDLRLWRGMIGYVPQETTLLHGSLRQNITLGDLTISDDAIYEALRLAGADRFVGELLDGLDTVAGEMGARFSGGQRQRIALARALVLQPKLLILDEVTSALDPDSEAEICANIAALQGSLTIVAVTHREAWTSIAGRIYRVDGGMVDPVEGRIKAAANSMTIR